MMYKKHKINDSKGNYDVSDARQREFSKLSHEQARAIFNLFENYKDAVPTQIKMQYLQTQENSNATSLTI